MIPSGKVAIVSHDSGGAEILSSLLNQISDSYILCLDGPAIKIFKRKSIPIQNFNLEEAIESADWVLTGTSWESNLEYKAICLARDKGKFVVSFLDHWVNYKERFTWHGPKVMPNQIWVGDIDAKKLAEKTFNDIKIRLINNPYWKDFQREFQLITGNNNLINDIYLLYISSNVDAIKKEKDIVSYTDNDISNRFLENIYKVIDKKYLKRISYRPHPSEKEIETCHFSLDDIKIKIDKNENLIDSLKLNTHVVGHNSMALVLSKICGLKTINIINDLSHDSKIPEKFIDYSI